MKATNTRSARKPERKRRLERGLAHDYEFDYTESKANRFTSRVERDVVVVVLDYDVAKVFADSKRVNALLRGTIAAVKKRGRRQAS